MPLQPPPRDQSGGVLPHDHTGILGLDGVIRRISEKQTITDKSGKRRVSSIAFRPSSGANGGMSVDLESLILEAKLDPKAFVTTPHWTGSVRFTAGELRAEGFSVGYDPSAENPYHGEVWGEFSKAKQYRLMELAILCSPHEAKRFRGDNSKIIGN